MIVMEDYNHALQPFMQIASCWLQPLQFTTITGQSDGSAVGSHERPFTSLRGSTMLITTIILFAIAAILGTILFSRLMQNRETPKPVVYMHGLVAAIGLILLIIVYANSGNSTLLTSLLIFIVAALGGFVMFGRDMAGRSIQKWLPMVHALAAVTAFVILLVVAF